ncbi:MAG TPA: hypothetical protein VJN68_11480 [Burkholderiaceae bacterium]|nr:hypothetical protein [Burkholderiaceae bacterium]
MSASAAASASGAAFDCCLDTMVPRAKALLGTILDLATSTRSP